MNQGRPFDWRWLLVLGIIVIVWLIEAGVGEAAGLLVAR